VWAAGREPGEQPRPTGSAAPRASMPPCRAQHRRRRATRERTSSPSRPCNHGSDAGIPASPNVVTGPDRIRGPRAPGRMIARTGTAGIVTLPTTRRARPLVGVHPRRELAGGRASSLASTPTARSRRAGHRTSRTGCAGRCWSLTPPSGCRSPRPSTAHRLCSACRRRCRAARATTRRPGR